ncbi:MAG: Hsp70 family protein, partial [Candidatus Thermoplasmatota archaeon]|nr:Hsp70 family protein [Candidatus Thermoplasmatota archaeon]
EEIEARVQDAETHAEEDKQLRELVETRNQCESLIYATEKSLKELDEKVDEETRKAIEEAKEPLKEAMKGDDIDALKAATEAYMTASQVVGQQMYQQAAEEAAQQAPTDEGDSPAAENVVDVDYEEIDEK